MASGIERVARIGRPMSIAEETQVRVAGLLKAVASGQANVSYTPTTPGNWAGSPTTVQAAIDRLAAAVHTLLGAPIP